MVATLPEEVKNVVVKIEVVEITLNKQAKLVEENSVMMKNFADMTELPPIMQNIFSDMTI